MKQKRIVALLAIFCSSLACQQAEAGPLDRIYGWFGLQSGRDWTKDSKQQKAMPAPITQVEPVIVPDIRPEEAQELKNLSWLAWEFYKKFSSNLSPMDYWRKNVRYYNIMRNLPLSDEGDISQDDILAALREEIQHNDREQVLESWDRFVIFTRYFNDQTNLRNYARIIQMHYNFFMHAYNTIQAQYTAKDDWGNCLTREDVVAFDTVLPAMKAEIEFLQSFNNFIFMEASDSVGAFKTLCKNFEAYCFSAKELVDRGLDRAQAQKSKTRLFIYLKACVQGMNYSIESAQDGAALKILDINKNVVTKIFLSSSAKAYQDSIFGQMAQYALLGVGIGALAVVVKYGPKTVWDSLKSYFV